jgi:hypothetical protein
MVVALAIADVAGQRLGQLVARILVDQIDDMVADECREPAHMLTALLDQADVRWCCGLDLDRSGIPAYFLG